MKMANVPTYPLARERNVILGALLVLAAAAWALLIWQMQMMDEDEMGLTMGMGAPVFLGIWVVMMAAMMFPTAAPMVLTFSRVQGGKKERGQVYVPTWIFVAAYLAVWVLFGALGYAAAVAAEALAEDSMWLMDNATKLGGGVLIVAGVYQLSPLKGICLTKCRSPMAFIHSSWRDGTFGAVRMGLEHGAFCLGCCWLLFVILFPLGVMNVAAMAVITLLIFAEKSLPQGRLIGTAAAGVLIAYGALVLAVPNALPTMM